MIEVHAPPPAGGGGHPLRKNGLAEMRISESREETLIDAISETMTTTLLNNVLEEEGGRSQMASVERSSSSSERSSSASAGPLSRQSTREMAGSGVTVLHVMEADEKLDGDEERPLTEEEARLLEEEEHLIFQRLTEFIDEDEEECDLAEAAGDDPTTAESPSSTTSGAKKRKERLRSRSHLTFNCSAEEEEEEGDDVTEVAPLADKSEDEKEEKEEGADNDGEIQGEEEGGQTEGVEGGQEDENGDEKEENENDDEEDGEKDVDDDDDDDDDEGKDDAEEEKGDEGEDGENGGEGGDGGEDDENGGEGGGASSGDGGEDGQEEGERDEEGEDADKDGENGGGEGEGEGGKSEEGEEEEGEKRESEVLGEERETDKERDRRHETGLCRETYGLSIIAIAADNSEDGQVLFGSVRCLLLGNNEDIKEQCYRDSGGPNDVPVISLEYPFQDSGEALKKGYSSGMNMDRDILTTVSLACFLCDKGDTKSNKTGNNSTNKEQKQLPMENTSSRIGKTSHVLETEEAYYGRKCKFPECPNPLPNPGTRPEEPLGLWKGVMGTGHLNGSFWENLWESTELETLGEVEAFPLEVQSQRRHLNHGNAFKLPFSRFPRDLPRCEGSSEVGSFSGKFLGPKCHAQFLEQLLTDIDRPSVSPCKTLS
ncbi:uncharacterized protein LOC135211297 [Macrobrachium nipponense]|uniref:uncharacterized protein LOC135211297 n=1 Tax=Macrobrachium nipponense TaxID=159736 RepID=UPI0030C7BF82